MQKFLQKHLRATASVIHVGFYVKINKISCACDWQYLIIHGEEDNLILDFTIEGQKRNIANGVIFILLLLWQNSSIHSRFLLSFSQQSFFHTAVISREVFYKIFIWKLGRFRIT